MGRGSWVEGRGGRGGFRGIPYEIRSQHYKDIINEKTVLFAWKQSYIKVQVDYNEVINSGVDECYARHAAENTSNHCCSCK